VTDGEGRIVGLLDLDAALAATADAMVRRMDLLARDDSIAGLKSVKLAQAGMARELLDEHVPAPEIQVFLTDINRDLYCRVIDRALAAMEDEGWGTPPVSLCVLIMGSGGRGENLLDPDQDNGFVLADYPDDAHWSIDRFFVELAERMTRDRTRSAFLSARAVMATNPLWRKTLPQWQDQIAWAALHRRHHPAGRHFRLPAGARRSVVVREAAPLRERPVAASSRPAAMHGGRRHGGRLSLFGRLKRRSLNAGGSS
jgi:signal-transduction protein with cAMP-binding, CBS, and nucleotidyltransferase domain